MDATVSFKAPSWTVENGEEPGEVDEPPEIRASQMDFSKSTNFTRLAIRRPSGQSTLTRAIHGQYEEDAPPATHALYAARSRRRSITSNISVASSAADLTSDTGFTSPARTNTPSPPLPEMAMLRLDPAESRPKAGSLISTAVQVAGQPAESDKPAPRKRCIQFACGGTKPAAPIVEPPQATAMVKTPSAQDAPRRTCIKFACPARPASTQNTPPRHPAPTSQPSTLAIAQPTTPKKSTPLSSATSSVCSNTPRRNAVKARPTRPRYLRANSSDLGTDGSHFHEFASEISREDDWIRDEVTEVKKKLTIDDTLIKENDIRRLAKEAEEEAEEEDDVTPLDDEDSDDQADEDEDDNDEDAEEDEDDGEDTVEEFDGYSTDEETGFAESDDSDDDQDENMALWTLGGILTPLPSSAVPVISRPPLREQHSDSSAVSRSSRREGRRIKPQRIQSRGDVSDLPDSTDFVCGTLDEDKPLEEAYMSRLAARRSEKLRIIPQDIDPSFPASDPEDEADEELFNPVHHDSDEEIFAHGQMDDIHHDQDRSRRRKKDQPSPKKYHSPPPRHRHHSPPPKHRHRSPPPKLRGKSPRPLFDRVSPRRATGTAAPKNMTTPTGSPRAGAQLDFHLAGRPGLTDTKSLPRPTALFCRKSSRMPKHVAHGEDTHIRGAIDIVKGLEKKRLRRKEKFDRNYCQRARRGQIPERKALPGRGAERMKELGLLMAGKKETGNYVLSV